MKKPYGVSLLINKVIKDSKLKEATSLESIIKIVGIIGAVITIIFSYKTYEDGEKWKKAEFSVAQFRKFQENKSVKLANEILDYDRRKLDLYNDSTLVVLDERTVARALIVDSAKHDFDDREARIREVFDEYFDELGLFNRYYKTNVVDSTVLRTYLKYQINLIADPNHKRKSRILKALQKQMWAYLDYYEFRDVQELCKTFSFDVRRKYPPIK